MNSKRAQCQNCAASLIGGDIEMTRAEFEGLRDRIADYLLSLLDGEGGDRCVKCGHGRETLSIQGFCVFCLSRQASEPGPKFCGCKCEFPAASVTTDAAATGGFECACCGRNMEVRVNGKWCNECAGSRLSDAAAVKRALIDRLKSLQQEWASDNMNEAYPWQNFARSAVTELESVEVAKEVPVESQESK